MILTDFLEYSRRFREGVQLYLTTATRLSGIIVAHDDRTVVLSRLDKDKTYNVVIVERSAITTYGFESANTSLRYWSSTGHVPVMSSQGEQA